MPEDYRDFGAILHHVVQSHIWLGLVPATLRRVNAQRCVIQ